MRKTVTLNLKDNPYKIHIGNDIIKEIPFYVKKLNIGNFSVVITNEKILSLHKKRVNRILQNLSGKIIKVPDGEKAKSKEWAFKIIEEIIKLENIKKRIFIICLGGGVIGDLGGFVASIYKRGIPYLQIPTTLLACVDASIGGKTAINTKEAKNIVGTFYQPKAVFIDPQFLYTLRLKELKEGFAEIIKYSIIKDKDLFIYLKNNMGRIKNLELDCLLGIIEKCVKIKVDIVERDEKEKKGIRTILNFGHTIGHGLEASFSYKKRLTHGEAVALGMVCASNISMYLGLCSKKTVKEIENLIKLYSLTKRIPLESRKILRSLILDKKFIRGTVRMVLISDIGKTKVCENISLKLIKKSLGDLNGFLKAIHM